MVLGERVIPDNSLDKAPNQADSESLNVQSVRNNVKMLCGFSGMTNPKGVAPP